jgi:hypothetical protein
LYRVGDRRQEMTYDNYCPKCGYEHNVDDPDTCVSYDDD